MSETPVFHSAHLVFTVKNLTDSVINDIPLFLKDGIIPEKFSGKIEISTTKHGGLSYLDALTKFLQEGKGSFIKVIYLITYAEEEKYAALQRSTVSLLPSGMDVSNNPVLPTVCPEAILKNDNDFELIRPVTLVFKESDAWHITDKSQIVLSELFPKTASEFYFYAYAVSTEL